MRSGAVLIGAVALSLIAGMAIGQPQFTDVNADAQANATPAQASEEPAMPAAPSAPGQHQQPSALDVNDPLYLMQLAQRAESRARTASTPAKSERGPAIESADSTGPRVTSWKVGLYGPRLNLQGADGEAPADEVDEGEGENANPAGAPDEKRPSASLDFANYRSPVNSFRYWLDTVTTTDEEFITVISDAATKRGGNPPSFAGLNATQKAQKIFQLRLGRLDASFDFERWYELEDIERTDVQKRQLREDKFRTWLSVESRQHLRERFGGGNIKTLRNAGKPDFNAGEASVYMKILDLTTQKDVLYRIDLTLFPEGLGWRWYNSTPVEMAELDSLPDEGETKPAVADDELERIQDEIAAYDIEIAKLSEQLEELRRERARKLDARQELVARRLELERELDPYGTPERTLRTALTALRTGNWQSFLSCHSERIRDANSDSVSAKAHFQSAAEGDDGRGSKVQDLGRIREKVRDRDNERVVYLTVEISISYRKQRSFDEVTNEDDDPSEGTEPPLRTGVESEVRKYSETKTVRLKFIEENGKWLIDEDIA